MADGRRVVFDAGILILLLQEGSRSPVDPQTKKPISRPKDRIEYLKECLSREKSKILIPTPALSEFLVNAGAALEKYVDDIANETCFAVVPFSQRAAIEAAAAIYQAKQIRRKQDDQQKAAWQRVKIDIQIVATAKVNAADVIYTTDTGVIAQAEAMEIPAIHLADISLPPTDPQQEIDFDKTDETQKQPDSQAADVRPSRDGPPEGQAAAEGEAESERKSEGEEG